MQVVNKFTMLLMKVSDMPKAKAFYADTLGLKITNEYRIADNNWYISVALPEGGVTINLTTFQQNTEPSTISLYLATSDLVAAHKALSDKGAKVNEIKDNLYGP